MANVLKKKNGEYSVNERRFTAIATFVVLAAFGYWLLDGMEATRDSKVLSLVGGAVTGLLFGYVGYRYPKVIHLGIFALPLMVIGT